MLISDSQFGFRKSLSTEDALLDFLTPVYTHMNTGKKVAALFIDITKAFDTVNHNILLNKLYDFGFRGNMHDFLKFYLKNRSQKVKIRDTLSNNLPINVGVPQGSVLGPVLFLLYIESIFHLNLIGRITAFADDLALSYVGHSYLNLKQQISDDLKLLRKWFIMHDMVLSAKSKVMFFDTSGNIPIRGVKYHSLNCDNLSCNTFCLDIESVSVFKYLGVQVDNQLNWKTHLEKLKKSLILANIKIYRLRTYVSREILKMVYFSLVDSHIKYGIASWGGTYKSSLRPIITLQKQIIRVINFRNRRTHTHPLFVKDLILPVRNLYIYTVLKIFFIRSGYLNNKETITYNLRYKSNCHYVKPRTELFRKFFMYTAPYVYNKLPLDLKQQRNSKQFLNLLKPYLLNKSSDEIEELFDVCK